MQKIIILLTTVVLIGACNLFDDRPKDILGEDEFVKVLVDIHMADGILATKGYNINRDSSTIELLYQDVIDKQQTSQDKFAKTVTYYSKSPSDFEKIYEQVSEELAKIESEFQEQRKDVEKEDRSEIKDSLKRENRLSKIKRDYREE